MKITLGVTTYGTLDRELAFLRSYWNNTEASLNEIALVCVDDGTPNLEKLRERESSCRRLKSDFIANGKNLGIPGAWNVILNYARDNKSDLCCIFNDDIRFITPGWLTRLGYFFDKNEKIGMAGFPLLNERGFNDTDPRWTCNPGLVGAAVGCAFCVRPEVALSVENPDGSRGFWQDLVSFHEEVHFGFRLSQLGYASLMLPWPPVLHQGGQTFGTNPELVWRDPSPYFPMEEFLGYVRKCRWYIPDYEQVYVQGKVDRMSYSRGMFCKYWGILNGERHREFDGIMRDTWEEPQIPVHKMVVPERLDREIHWINKADQEVSCQV